MVMNARITCLFSSVRPLHLFRLIGGDSKADAWQHLDRLSRVLGTDELLGDSGLRHAVAFRVLDVMPRMLRELDVSP